MFNEAQYLAQNPDVAAAVKKGLFKSGLDHYNRYGKAEIAKGTRKPAQEQVSSDPFDAMKRAFNSSSLVQSGLDFDAANPFSNFFNADKVREMIRQKYQPDFQRQTDTLNADDASFRRDEGLAYKDNLNYLDQTAANNDMLFGGARKAQINKLSTSRQNSMDDYVRKLNEAKFTTEREQNRVVDNQFNIEKDLANSEYQDRKKKDTTSRFTTPGYSI